MGIVLCSAGATAGSGMPDTGAVLALLVVQPPVCVECLSAKSDVPLAEIEPMLSRISATIALNCIVDRCRACGRTDRVYSAFRPE
jgi:hypothetical protein